MTHRRSRSDRATTYASFIFGDTPADTAARAEEALARGLRAVKFGWGPIGLDEEIDTMPIEAARAALGSDTTLIVDAGNPLRMSSEGEGGRGSSGGVGEQELLTTPVPAHH